MLPHLPINSASSLLSTYHVSLHFSSCQLKLVRTPERNRCNIFTWLGRLKIPSQVYNGLSAMWSLGWADATVSTGGKRPHPGMNWCSVCIHRQEKSSLSSLASIVLIFKKSMVLGLGTAEASRNFSEIWILRCLPNVHNQPQGHAFFTLFPEDSNRPNVYEFLSYRSVSLFHLDCFSAKLCSTYKLAYTNRNVLNIYIFYSCTSLNAWEISGISKKSLKGNSLSIDSK